MLLYLRNQAVQNRSVRKCPSIICIRFIFVNDGMVTSSSFRLLTTEFSPIARKLANSHTRGYYLCYLMSCDDSSLFRCVTRIQAINFFRKVKYNLLNETIWRIFLVICFIHICLAYSGYMPGVWWQCLCAIIMLISFCTFILKLM